MLILDKYSLAWFSDSLENDFKGLVDFMDSLFEPRFSVSQMGISRQELLYWRKMDLLQFEAADDKRSWVKVDFFEYCFIRLVAELRKLNVPLESIRILKANILHVDEETIKEMLAATIPALETQKLDPTLAELDLKAHMLSPTKAILDGFKKYFNPFNILVISLMLQARSLNLLVNQTGQCYLFQPEELNTTVLDEERISFLNRPYVSIPLHTLLDEFFLNPKIRTINHQQIFNLSAKQSAILNMLKKENFLEIKIRLNKERKGELIVQLTEQKQIPETQATIKSLLKKGNYQNIQLKTENGHIVLYEETTKYKL